MQSSCCNAGLVWCFLNAAAGCFLQQDLLDSFARGSTHGDDKTRNLQFCPGGWQITQLREDKSANGVDSFRCNLKPQMFAYIIKPRVSAHEKFPILKRLNVKIDISPRDRVAKNFLHDIRHGDDAFSASKLIYHHGYSLGMGQKKLEQLQCAHRLRHKRGSD